MSGSTEVALVPHVLDSEQALLGAILLNGAALDGVRNIVQPEDFVERVHGHLYGVMCQRRDAGEVITASLLRHAVGDADLGGTNVFAYLGRLVAEATNVVNAPSYARSIRDAAHMRRVLETAQAAVAEMTAGNIAAPSDYAAQMIEDLDAVVTSGLPESVRRVRLGESALGVFERVKEAKAGKIRRGAPYGLPTLDKATLGMRDNQLIILAGRPGMGKTATAIHLAISAARAGYGVGFFSLEMDAGELAERALSALAYDARSGEKLTYRDIAYGAEITERGMDRLQRAVEFCQDIPLEIEQQPGLNLSQIAARARQMRMRFERKGHFLGAIIIDHIGLIKPSKRYSGNRVQEMTEISGSLKGLAKELGIPIVGLAQLNRESEKRPDKRPLLSDLRDSGSIEQDADVVIGLYREAYYLEHQSDLSFEEIDRLAQVRDTLEIEILKQRGGPTKRISCFCDIACNVLAEMA